jgi:multiple sugar transport system substrate-binding protein
MTKVVPMRFLIIILISLAACQPAENRPTATSSAPDTTTAQALTTSQATTTPDAASELAVKDEALKGLQIQVWHPWFGVEANLFQSQVDDFNRTNQWGIHIQATSQLNYNELFQNVVSSLPSSNNPQLVVGLPEYALLWNTPDGTVVDLTGYVDDPRYGLSDEVVKDIPSVFWSQDEVGGERLGIPAERSARFLLYNQSWARDLGFNSAPITSEEFRQQACAAHATMLNDKPKSNDAMGGWLVDTQTTTALSWLKAFGGGVLNGDGYRFLTPDNVDAFIFLKQLYDDKCAWTTTDPSGVYDAFANRKALFSTAGLEELSDQSRAFGAANNIDEWTVLSFPGSVQSGLTLYGSSYIMLKSTPEKKLASWLFIRWMLSPEIQAKWVEALGLFPLRASSMDMLKDYGNSHPQWKAALALLPSAQNQPQMASWRKVQIMLGDGFSYMFRTDLDNLPAIASNQPAAVLSQMDSLVREHLK